MNEEEKKEIRSIRKKLNRQGTIYMVLSVLGVFALITIFAVAVRFFPEPYDMITISTLTIGIGSLFLFFRIKNDRDESKVDEDEFEGQVDDWDEDFEEEEEEERDPNKLSIIVMTGSWGLYYQLFKIDEDYLFMNIGSQTKGLLIEEVENIEDINVSKILENKKNFMIKGSEITSLEFKKSRFYNLQIPYGGTITLYLGAKKKRLSVFGEIALEIIQKIFPDIKIIETKPDKPKVDNRVEDSVSNHSYRKFKRITWALDIASLILGCLFMFANLPYDLISIGLCLCLFSFLLLYLVFPKIFSIMEGRGDQKGRKKIFVLPQTLLILCLFGLRDLLDFNFVAYGRYIIVSIVISLIFIFIFLICSKEYKKIKSTIFIIIFIGVVFGFAITPNLNYTLDFKQAHIYSSQVYDKRFTGSSNSPDSFYLQVMLQNGNKKEIKVSQKLYDKIEIGSLVDVHEFEGLFKIHYCFLEEKLG